MIEHAEFQEAFTRLKVHIQPTPLRYSSWLSDILGGEVYLKLECLNPGRSFKIRGATNTLLLQKKLPELVITASGGNHGLGVAIAARRLNIPCKVVLPVTTSDYRIKLLEQLDAEVELVGDAWDEANEYALELAEKDNCLYIHPFADKEVMMGQGTIIHEVHDQGFDMDNLDNFVASVGGGGLLAGNALAIKGMELDTNIIAVETIGADSLAQSLAAEKLIELDAITSIAKTLGAKTTTPQIFDIMQEMVDTMLVVSDKDSVKALFEFLDHEKLLIEPATACIIAAAQDNPELFKDKTTLLVVCGSNLTYQEALDWKEEFLS